MISDGLRSQFSKCGPLDQLHQHHLEFVRNVISSGPAPRSPESGALEVCMLNFENHWPQVGAQPPFWEYVQRLECQVKLRSLFIIFQPLTVSLFAGYLELNSPRLNALWVKLSRIHNYVVVISSAFFFQNVLIKAI